LNILEKLFNKEENLNKKEKRNKKWSQIPEIQSQDEYMDFINQSLANRGEKNKKIKIGETTENSRKNIGKDVTNIGIDNHGIIHAHKKKHNLEPDDLLHAVDIINNADEVKQARKHSDNDVASFIKDINGNIELLAEIHELQDFLMVFNAWRQKKVRNRPDAVNRPPEANVQNATQPTMDPAGNDAYARNLANSGNTQSTKNITQASPNVKGKK